MSSPGGSPDPNNPYSGYSGYPGYPGYPGHSDYSGHPGYSGYPQQGHSVDPLTGQPVTPNQQASWANPYQQGQGYPGMVAPKRQRNNKPALAAIAATAGFVLIVGVAVVGVWLGGGFGRESGGGASPDVPPASEPSSEPIEPPPSSPEPSEPKSPSSEQTFIPANTPGWKGISWPRYGIAYDVPPSWNPKPGSISGVESKGSTDKQTVSAYSVSQEDVCGPNTGSYRAKAGVSSIKEPDPAKAADTALQKWARLGFGTDSGQPPQVATQPTVPVTVDGRQGFLATGTVTPAQPSPCDAPNTVISVVTFRGNSGTSSVGLLGVADQSVPDATSPEDLKRVLTSLRWLPN